MTMTPLVDQSLDPIAGALTPEVAQRLIELQPPAAVVAKMEEYAAKASAGTLSAVEEQEYKTLIDLGDVVGLLKLKAKRLT